MITPEKNDVDVSRLFHWGRGFEIFDRFGNKITVAYIRLVGDAEVNRSRVFAIRRAAELRKTLKDENSDDRIAFISSVIEIENKEELIDMVVNLNIRKFAQEATREIKLPMPKEPKADDELEVFEKFQQEVDTFEERRNSEINKVTLEKLDAFRTSIENMKLDDLRKLYEKHMIDMLCEQKMMNTFKDSCAYYGTYADEDFQKRMFNSFDEFDNLPTEIKDQYVSNYNSLEINLDELKKSLEATPS